jgi:hypothetical protein
MHEMVLGCSKQVQTNQVGYSYPSPRMKINNIDKTGGPHSHVPLSLMDIAIIVVQGYDGAYSAR